MTTPASTRKAPLRLSGEAAALAVPLSALAALHHPSLGFFFMRDDPCLLASARESGIAAHLVDPVTWRGLSSTLFMPWQIVSLGLDLKAFGLEPAAFYAHHLLSFGLLLVVAYVTLRRFLAAWSASLALVLFVASPPSLAVGALLMNRHYLEGLVFALAAFGLHLEARKRASSGLAVLSALFYALACGAKEVFVPLPLLLIISPGDRGSARTRLVWASPHAAVALGYAVYRLYMLGWSNTFETYGPSLGRGGPVSLSSFGVAAAVTVAVATLLACARAPRRLALVAATALAVALPLAFLTSPPEPRHYFVPALLGGMAVALAVEELAGGRLAIALPLALGLTGATVYALATSPLWTGLPGSERHYRAEGLFIRQHEGEAVLLTSLENTLYLSCTARLRPNADGVRSGQPKFCGEPCLCESWFGAGPRYRYEGGAIVEVEDDRAPEACETRAPIEAVFRYDPDASRVSWELGTREAGTYQLLLLSGTAPRSISIPLAVPRRGEAPLFLERPLELIVKYRSPEGWLAFSPVQTLAP